ncbi:hypothetical protein SAMN02910298_02780 [Pseudobutyrivibrio sp. YE44]|uniref:hypothetical protein n=1 Tax=Pseudobutyrivibrio sp. YE44 TaxID=1520802 RepID=UPI0008866338|nr:hypothetical protein [Pseudobutyrivibrio sp. YE44]SDB54340.1 hypothetical protein SAMN02910298_02780 [Pseudobutyrivibrio sp. YE44]
MKKIGIFLLEIIIYAGIIFSILLGVNYSVDAASVIKPEYNKMASLALSGNAVVQPENYNERAYQLSVMANMKKMPDTVVIGSSRGMFLGKDITGIDDIYNNCVSGACLEDYYALFGLYDGKFGAMPSNVILEVSPWVFWIENPEARWKENPEYYNAACEFYQKVNGESLGDKAEIGFSTENPYTSLAYFQYNMEVWYNEGSKVFEENAKVSTDESEAAEYPDGTIRYASSSEHYSEERLKNVKDTSSGPCYYQNSDQMEEVDANLALHFENLIDYLQGQGVELTIYIAPFSETQCQYIYDQNTNPGFAPAEEYLRSFCESRNIKIIGDYDARSLGLTDKDFVDFMHLDKEGTRKIWE